MFATPSHLPRYGETILFFRQTRATKKKLRPLGNLVPRCSTTKRRVRFADKIGQERASGNDSEAQSSRNSGPAVTLIHKPF
jgi:hypothetical protein